MLWICLRTQTSSKQHLQGYNSSNLRKPLEKHGKTQQKTLENYPFQKTTDFCSPSLHIKLLQPSIVVVHQHHWPLPSTGHVRDAAMGIGITIEGDGKLFHHQITGLGLAGEEHHPFFVIFCSKCLEWNS